MDPLIFIIALAILIFVHELGHFIAAKKLGMYVEEFAIGFPPRLFGRKIKDTVYSLNAVPIGGYVKIFGESEADLEELQKNDPDYKQKLQKAFYNQKNWKRVIVLLAGVGMNFLFGWAVISTVFVRGVAVPGDRVKVVSVAQGSPAEKSGIRKDDVISYVDGKKIKSSEDLLNLVDKNLGRQVKLGIARGSENVEVKLVPRKNPPAGQGAIGVVISDFIKKKYSFLEAPWLGLKESVKISRFFYGELFGGIKQFIKGGNPQVSVSGPVGIYNAYSERDGFFEKLLLTGLISLNLALINIFPFPALDGGHLLFIGIEAATRKKISAQVKQKITYAGMLILLFIIAIVTIKDILRIL